MAIPPLVDFPIGYTDNRPEGLVDGPVGDTDNRPSDGLKDQPRGGTDNSLRDLGPIVVAGYVPLNGTEPGIVFGANFNNEQADVTGNHTIGSTILFTAAKSYDGLRYAAQLPGNSASRIFTTAGTAHQIATAAAVSYGGMFFIEAATSDDNAMHLSSSTTTGASNQNYGMRYKKSTAHYQRVPGAADTVYGGAALEGWVHLVVVEPAGRGSALWYVNGVYQETTTPAATGTPNGTDDIWIGELAGQAGTNAAGWATDVFISNLELSAAQVLQFATNAFGGTPPAVP